MRNASLVLMTLSGQFWLIVLTNSTPKLENFQEVSFKKVGVVRRTAKDGCESETQSGEDIYKCCVHHCVPRLRHNLHIFRREQSMKLIVNY